MIKSKLKQKSLEKAFQQIFSSKTIRNSSLLALSLTTPNVNALPVDNNQTLLIPPSNSTHKKHQIKQELLIIDSRVNDLDTIIAKRKRGLSVIVVNDDEDGLEVISQAILKYPEATTIHVVSHGQAGQMILGKTTINENQLNSRAGAIHQWQGKGKNRPDLLVYGCEIAKGQRGHDFIKTLSTITGFDVAASTNLTGQSSLGGDWQLEAATGWIEASLAWQETDIQQIQGILAAITVSNLNDAGAGSLRAALGSVAIGDTIDFSVTGTITLSTGELLLNTNNITLMGPGETNLTIDANGTSRVLHVTGNDSIISGVTLTGGSAVNGAGVFQRYATNLTISDSTITGNTASSYGGGMYIRNLPVNSNIALNNVTFSYNSATQEGGGLNFNGSSLTVTITNSTFTNNAANNGAGVRSKAGNSSLTLNNTNISSNTATAIGGGISIDQRDNALLIENNSTISNNSAGFNGGGINSYITTTLTINNSTISGNSSAYGGGMSLHDGTNTLNNVNLTNNTASSDGAGIYAHRSNVTLNLFNSTVSNNSAGSSGGGVRFGYNYGYLNIDNTLITNNSATIHGGGIYIYVYKNNPTIDILNSTISNNTAGNSGGGLSFYSDKEYDVFGQLTLDNVRVTGNQSNSRGGGLDFQADYALIPITINNCTIDNNSSQFAGGGINIEDDYGDADLTISNSTISNNSSKKGGGIFLYKDTGGGVSKIFNTTISGNTATPTAGGNSSSGGGLLIDSSTYKVFIVNSTISNNSSVGTYAYGGGLYNNGDAYIQNSIISGNTAQNYGNDVENLGQLTIANNLIGDDAGLLGVGTNVDNGGNIINVDPLLKPLQNNGGITQTHALTPGSPALDVGSNALIPPMVTLDQRGTGFPRIVNTTVDMGAVEGAVINVALSLTGSPMAENGGVATVTATADFAPANPITVNLAFSGTATTATDFTPSAALITIPAGATTGTMTLTAIDDLNDEADESIIVDISSVSGAVETGIQQVTATITDDDIQQVSLAVTNSPFAENAGVANVTATLNAVSSFNVTVDLGFTGSATNAVDYTPSATQLIIPAGSLSLDMTLTGVDDVLIDPNETVIVDITNVTNGAELGGMQQVTAVITDDEIAPQATVSLSSTSVQETAGNVIYTVTLDIPAPAGGVTIDLAFSGSATNPADYTSSSNQIVIPAGATTGAITFSIINDALPEPDETIVIDVIGINNAVVSGSTTAVVTILGSAVIAVPTLSKWALMLLGLLMPTFVVKRLRRKKKTVEFSYK